MLGYVRTEAGELRMREYESYRALYCGLCRRMGKCTGQCSRLTLSYDFVFLAALRYSFQKEVPVYQKKRCLLHPLKPRLMAEGSAALDYCANASALLSYNKCLDDCNDERGWRRLRAHLARLLLRSAYKRAKRKYPALDAAIHGHMERLSAYELSPDGIPSADTPAAIFGDLMAEVFAEGLEDGERRIASEIGRAVGHWIYLADAADDLCEDQKKKRFNPLLLLFQTDLTAESLEDVKCSMLGQLMRGERALQLIDSFSTPEIKEIICNILYLGMPSRAERILKETAQKMNLTQEDKT